MIGPDMKASISIKNVVEVAPITVKPILYLSNGHRFTLPDLPIEPAGTAVIDINQALQDHWGISGWATLVGYVEIQYSWAWDAACATISDLDLTNSLSYSFVLQPRGEKAPAKDHTRIFSSKLADVQSAEGVWWKQEPNVLPFVSLSNVSAQEAAATVQTLDSQGNMVQERSFVFTPHQTRLIHLSEVRTLTDNVGGVAVRYPNNPGAIIVSGGLEDRAVGYSAHIPFNPSMDLGHKISLRSYTEVGLMFGAADPMMRFPAGTVFTPYSVLRNIADRAVQVTPYLYWMQGAVAQSAQLEPFKIAAGAAVSLDVRALAGQAGLHNFNGDLTLSFDVNTVRGSLILAGGSVDQKNTYVFEAMPSRIAESMGSTLSYWDTSNGNDTMVTVWNPSAEAEDLAFKIFFSGGNYTFPIHLEPRAMNTFIVSDIVKSQIPDLDGNVIPPSVVEGSATIQGTRSDVEHIFVNMDAGIYNVKKATCGWKCEYCSGASDWWIVDDPFAVPVTQNHQLTYWVQLHGGNQLNETSGSDWSSTNNGVATVSTGLVHGASTGTATIDAYIDLDIYGQVCGGPPECPFDDGLQAGSGGDVISVAISCSPTDLSLGSSAPQSTITGNCTATGAPSGGSYTWSVNKNTVTLTPSQSGTTATYTSNAASSSNGDTSITVKYTMNSQNVSATSAAITVHQPTTLTPSSVYSTGTAPCTTPCILYPGAGNCDASPTNKCKYNANQFQREYKVNDQFGTFFQNFGINNATVTEQVNLTSNNCSGSGVGQGSSTYTDFFDNFAKCDTCCQSGGPGCTTVAAQTLLVNGFSVRSTTITVTCTTVTVVP